jgi:hypothetical protein
MPLRTRLMTTKTEAANAPVAKPCLLSGQLLLFPRNPYTNTWPS